MNDLGNTPAIVLSLYLLALLMLGIFGFLKSKQGEEDYYLAGRTQGWFVSAITILATFFSSFALLGAPGLVYKEGVVFTLFALNVPLAGASVYLLGAKICTLGHRKGYVTPADMIADYYNSPVLLRLLVAGTGFLYAIPYVMIQIKAGGDLSAVLFKGSELSLGSLDTISAYQMGAVLLSLITMAYIMIGGMRSVAWTDVMQGLLLMGGMLLGGLAMVVSFGGIGAFGEAISTKLPESSLTLPGNSGVWGWPMMLSLCLIASTGSMVQPAQWMRFYSAKNRGVLRRSALVFALALPPCFLLGVMLVGLGGQVIYPLEINELGVQPAAEVGQFDRILIVALKDQLPEMLGPAVGLSLASLVLVAIMAASMSTADSNLHALSAVTVRDIYGRFLRRQANEKERVWAGRAVIVLATLLSLFFVLTGTGEATSAAGFMQMIALLGLMAIAFSAQLLPLTIDILYLRRGTASGAACGLVAGLLGAFCFGQMFAPFSEWAQTVLPSFSHVADCIAKCKTWIPIHASAWGLLINVPVFVLVSCITRALPKQHIQEFVDAMGQ